MCYVSKKRPHVTLVLHTLGQALSRVSQPRTLTSPSGLSTVQCRAIKCSAVQSSAVQFVKVRRRDRGGHARCAVSREARSCKESCAACSVAYISWNGHFKRNHVRCCALKTHIHAASRGVTSEHPRRKSAQKDTHKKKGALLAGKIHRIEHSCA